MKIIRYFKFHITRKRQIPRHTKKIIISQFFHIKKKSLSFRRFCFREL